MRTSYERPSEKISSPSKQHVVRLTNVPAARKLLPELLRDLLVIVVLVRNAVVLHLGLDEHLLEGVGHRIRFVPIQHAFKDEGRARQMELRRHEGQVGVHPGRVVQAWWAGESSGDEWRRSLLVQTT